MSHGSGQETFDDHGWIGSGRARGSSRVSTRPACRVRRFCNTCGPSRGSDSDFFQLAGRAGHYQKAVRYLTGRVGSGPVRRFSTITGGSDRIGSKLEYLTGRIGSGREIFKYHGWIGSGYPDPTPPNPTRPARSDLIHEMPFKI